MLPGSCQRRIRCASDTSESKRNSSDKQRSPTNVQSIILTTCTQTKESNKVMSLVVLLIEVAVLRTSMTFRTTYPSQVMMTRMMTAISNLESLMRRWS